VVTQHSGITWGALHHSSDTSEELIKAAYGSNYARLVQIKKKYDPKNVLRLNQNIRPV